MILGIGCDILKRSRISELLLKGSSSSKGPSRIDRLDRFSRRILSEREQGEFAKIIKQVSGVNNELESFIQHDRLLNYLAVRWAAKEACYKAFYPHEKLSWQSLSITRGGAQKEDKGKQVHSCYIQKVNFLI